MFKVTEDAMRPATPARECFYCNQAIGAEHKADCVTINKRVKVRATIEYEIDVPASWDKEQVEFHRNEGSWCSDNMLADLECLMHDGGCLCGIVEYEMLQDSSEYFLAD
jgi:hypothetical protein